MATMVVASSAVSTGQVPSFYSMERLNPDSPNLVRFTANPADAGLDVIGPSSTMGPVHSVYMDFSPDGRLFVAPYGGTVYELDTTTGAVLESLVVSSHPIEGLAARDNGELYVSIENGSTIRKTSFDQGSTVILVDHPYEIDGLDFDDNDNLIGNDINQSGQFYRIPLDGSQPQLIATLPVAQVSYTTFSSEDNSFYFVDHKLNPGGNELWRLSWENGLPAGSLEYVKQFGSGHYVGLAALPEPATLSLLTLGGLAVLRRRKRGGGGEDQDQHPISNTEYPISK